MWTNLPRSVTKLILPLIFCRLFWLFNITFYSGEGYVIVHICSSVSLLYLKRLNVDAVEYSESLDIELT